MGDELLTHARSGHSPDRRSEPDGSAFAAGGGARPPLIQSELWQLLRTVRESAELSYSRQLAVVELDRRILLLLHGAGPRVPAEIAVALGVDKAQVSRSVKRLLDRRSVQRQHIRSPLGLTRTGEALAERLLRIADQRNDELTRGIGAAELSAFFAVIELLLERAMGLYERERELAAARADGPPAGGGSEPAGPIAIDRLRIVPPLMTLSAYAGRSGALAFRRLTGLSSFEAFVLSEIGLAPPVHWSALAKALQRDHSQAGRTVRRLVERGLVRREGRQGRRHGRFSPTEEGARLYQAIHAAGRERSAFLLAPLDHARRAQFLATFAAIRRNAAAQLERERALAGQHRDAASARA